jgi:hypothetical protein
MKNGGWLDNYGKEDNYNDSQASAPEGMVGDGFSNVGRNYSPAWGGQFEEGGEIPMAQKGKKVKYVESANDPRYKAYQDSLSLFKENKHQQFTEDNFPEMKNKVMQVRIPYNSLQELPKVKGKRVGFERKDNTTDEINKKSVIYSEKIKPEYFNLNKFINWDDEYQLTGYYKKPQQQVIVKPTTTKQTTKPSSGYILQADGSKFYDESVPSGKFFDPSKYIGDGPIKYENILQEKKPVKAIQNNLKPAGLAQGDFNINANVEIQPEVKHAKSWKYNTREGRSEESGYVNSPEDMDYYTRLKDFYQTGAGKDLGNKVEITPHYQMGGSVYPVNYVPEAQMGGSLPGATGHMYARYEEGGKVPGDVGFSYPRIGEIPSNGPGAKKTMASAQNGKEMQYYQNGLDFQPKSISKNGSWLSKYDVAQNGKQVEYGTPEYREAYNKGEVVTDQGVRSPIQLDEVVVSKKSPAPGFWKQSRDKYLEEHQDDGILGAIGSVATYPLGLAQQAMMYGLTGKVQTPTEGMGIRKGMEGFPGTILNVVADPVMFMGELGKAPELLKSGVRALGTEEGLLSNAHKLNPKSYQRNLPENTMWRGLGKEGMEDAVNSGLFRSKQNVPAEFFPGSTLRMDKSFGTNPYFTPRFETASTYGDNFLAEVPKDVANWRNRYTRSDWSQIADRPIPINEGRLLQKDWLQGYKEVPKKEEGGIIKDDRGQWDHPWEDTEISGDTMRTDGYGNIPLYVVPDVGEPRMVYPNTGTHTFPGATKFTEYPKGKKPNKAQNGLRQEQKGLQNLDQLTNFTNYNKPQPGGWLNKYN